MFTKYMSNTFKNIINKKKLMIILLFIISYLYFRSGITYKPVEELDIPSAIGLDIMQRGKDSVQYSVPISFYNYGQQNKISTFIHTGVGSSLSETRQTRQQLVNKKMILGIERIIIASEAYSKFSIRNWMDILSKNPNINDTALAAVCKGKSEDILSYKIPEYPSSADYIEGLIDQSVEFNFFSDNYKVKDIFVRLDAEGRGVVLPFIEILDGKVQVTGMAVFKKDKMIKKIDMDKAKAMNILRENKVRGMLVLQESSKEYISYYASTKRKVRCEKKDGKYIFYVDLFLNGEIVENDLHKNDKTMKSFEKKMSTHVEELCKDFIYEMQSNYKVDCLELGRVAAATYGRHTGVEWNEIICDHNKTEIRVNVKVKVDKMGRGDYNYNHSF